MLGVHVPPAVAANALHGPLGAELGELLEAMPVELRLETASADHVAAGSRADQAWQMLERQHKVGWVTAGKMLARKRPHLVPVYDDVVRCWLLAAGCWLRAPAPGTFWESLRFELQRDDGRVAQQLRELHAAAKLPSTVSLARVLDVLIWRRHAGPHRRGSCT